MNHEILQSEIHDLIPCSSIGSNHFGPVQIVLYWTRNIFSQMNFAFRSMTKTFGPVQNKNDLDQKKNKA